MTGPIDPFEICPRYHGGGHELVIGRTLRERIRGLLRPDPCYVCAGAGEVQRSLGAKRMGELVQLLQQVIKAATR